MSTGSKYYLPVSSQVYEVYVYEFVATVQTTSSTQPTIAQK